MLYDVFRRAAQFIPSSVAIVSGEDFSFTVSTLCPVSFEPPLVSVCVKKGSRLDGRRTFVAGLLREDQETAAREGKPAEPVVELTCDVEQAVEAGDHSIVIAAVRRVAIAGGRPLVYWKRAFFGLHLDYPFLASAEALDEFVAGWREGTLPKAAWTHSAHVAVTAYHAFDYSLDELFAAMKQGIVHFNVCVGTVNGPDSGYHETLTRFWSEAIAEFTRERKCSSRWEAVRQAVDRFGEDRDLYRMYYDFDVAKDRRARAEWIAPHQDNDQLQ